MPIHRRLKLAFGLFVGTLLLIFWLASLVYYFWEERQDAIDDASTQAAIIAKQSSAAVVFEDRPLLEAQLSLLSLTKDVHWALIAAPDSAGVGRAIAVYGVAPKDLEQLRATLAESGGRDVGPTRLRLVEPIVHNGQQRGELFMEIDFEADLNQLLRGAIASLALGLMLLWLGGRTFERILLSVSGPIAELVALAARVTTTGITKDRASAGARDEIGQLSLTVNHMLDALAAHEADLERSRDDLRALAGQLQAVREDERTRISHEIHDELGQRMTAIKYEVARLTEGKVREQLSAMTDETITVVRSISWELRPALLDSLGLFAAIEWLAHDFQSRTGISCALSLPKDEMVPDPALSTDLFRICQELLTNVARHAKASQVELHLVLEDRQIVLEVEDDGVGFDVDGPRPGSPSLGLLGVRERAMHWGGQIQLTAAAGKGTHIRVCLPLEAARSKGE